MSLPRLRTVARWAGLALFLAAAVFAVWLFTYGGRFLQHEDPLVKADAIFVLSGTRAERPLEALDLYNQGWAPIVVLSPGRPENGELMLRSRGIRFPIEVELERDALVQLGLPLSAIIATDGYVDNTAQ